MRNSLRQLSVAVTALLLLACNTTLSSDNILGPWGGDHALLTLSNSGGTVEYDCATGSVANGWSVSSDGHFTATGSYFPGHGGPIRLEEDTISRPARYDGTIRGNQMSLVVVLTDSATLLGTFRLTRGSAGSVFKCL